MEVSNTVKVPAITIQQRTILSKMSVVQKLRSPDLEVLVALKEILQGKKVKRPVWEPHKNFNLFEFWDLFFVKSTLKFLTQTMML